MISGKKQRLADDFFRPAQPTAEAFGLLAFARFRVGSHEKLLLSLADAIDEGEFILPLPGAKSMRGTAYSIRVLTTKQLGRIWWALAQSRKGTNMTAIFDDSPTTNEAYLRLDSATAFEIERRLRTSAASSGSKSNRIRRKIEVHPLPRDWVRILEAAYFT